ncbi:hypothetical protein F511_21711 [Dorcoceras hygrometricum]|uniref:Uncharacterized protein n=1 Tax=Dorcoceras hygrometricum TaxID=472368 RepID=A0A2Z7BQM2_9LAMI|nr:hypothetical protein F511_21711 [Dorcoceras hygrometricum]
MSQDPAEQQCMDIGKPLAWTVPSLADLVLLVIRIFCFLQRSCTLWIANLLCWHIYFLLDF